MSFFDTYVSNTLAGSGNQTFFESDGTRTTGRVFYRVFCGGAFGYAFLFSNTVDSTFDDGSHSYKNLVLPPWKLHALRVGITDRCDETSFAEPAEMVALTVDGLAEKTVAAGELFYTDPVPLAPEKDQYLCLEITFSGTRLPYHEESLLPSFVRQGGQWVPSKRHPFASMVGCDRPVKKRVGFLGDSITQGVGTEVNAYTHWNSVAAQQIGAEYAYWNLGLGYGRADDAASDGAWLRKAKENDVVTVCFGVNDILQGYSAEAIKKNLAAIVEKLQAAAVQVILQTVPPFDYEGAQIATWNEVNDYILTELRGKVAFVFDARPILRLSEAAPHRAKYGGHPNAEGCQLWGDAIGAKLREFLEQ